MPIGQHLLGNFLNGTERELGEIQISLEFLKGAISRVEKALHDHNDMFTRRLDSHEAEERLEYDRIWKKIGNLSNIISWACGAGAAIYMITEFLLRK